MKHAMKSHEQLKNVQETTYTPEVLMFFSTFSPAPNKNSPGHTSFNYEITWNVPSNKLT